MSATVAPLNLTAHFSKTAGRTYVERPVTSPGAAVKTVWVPDDWDQTSIDILATKYLLKAGVPSEKELVIACDEYRSGDVPDWLKRSVPASAGSRTKALTFGPEVDARQVFHRLAGCWTYWGWRLGYFANVAEAEVFYKECFALLESRTFAPNSPQFFNTGIHWAYGTEGAESGQYAIAYSPDASGRLKEVGTVEAAGPAHRRPAPSACFILGVKDSLLGEGGIYDTFEREARIFKYGGGAGANYSNLRGKGEPLTGGGVSSGLMSFLDIGDAGGGAIKSGGTTRRAARMVVLDVDHPEIEEFVRWKAEEEYRVACTLAGDKLIRAYRAGDCGPRYEDMIPDGLKSRLTFADVTGADPVYPDDPYTSHFDGKASAYVRAGGQNSNNSVRVTAGFLEAALMKREWHLIRRTDGKTAKTVRADHLWSLICRAAWTSGDPGVQFDTTINDWNTCPKDGRIRGTNPCGEYHWLDDTACNLGSIRLTAFLGGRDDAGRLKFDVNGFVAACRLATVVLDITVGMAAYPSREIADGSRKYRTLGLGYADLGSMLMRMGVGYDSVNGRAWAACVTSLMHSTATETSAKLAARLGTFPRFTDNREDVLRVVVNYTRWALRAAGYSATDYVGLSAIPFDVSARGVVPNGVLDAMTTAATTSAILAEHHGLRNAQLTLLAPCGTIGLLMGCDTTGVEPAYSLIAHKKLIGGGYIKLLNAGVPDGLASLGYGKAQIEDIGRHIFGHGDLPDSAVHVFHEVGLGRSGSVGTMIDRMKAGDSLETAARAAVPKEKWQAILKRLWGNRRVDSSALTVPADDQAFRPVASILLALGYPAEKAAVTVAEWDRYFGGHGHVEGAPHLKADHLGVFDCATPAGSGTRFIAPAGHVLMMAAVQPALSGGISKTVNMPKSATPQDVAAVYELAAVSGCKSVALYIDGQKLSQPLTADTDAPLDADGIVWAGHPNAATGEGKAETRYVSDDGWDLPIPGGPPAEDEPAADDGTGGPENAVVPDVHHFFRGEPQQLTDEQRAMAKEDYAKPPVSPRPAKRVKLPSRRDGYTQKIAIGGQNFFLTANKYPDGKPGEIFIRTAKNGAAFRAFGDAIAIAVSLGLQHGVPLDEYVDAFVGMRFEPAGVVTDHPRMKMAGSILDAVFRDLAIEFLKADELAHVQPPQTTGESSPPPADDMTARIAAGEFDQADGDTDQETDVDPFVDLGSNDPAGYGVIPDDPQPVAPDAAADDDVLLEDQMEVELLAERITWTQAAPPATFRRVMPGATGDPCRNCGNFTVFRTGTCSCCRTCGESSGCV